MRIWSTESIFGTDGSTDLDDLLKLQQQAASGQVPEETLANHVDEIVKENKEKEASSDSGSTSSEGSDESSDTLDTPDSSDSTGTDSDTSDESPVDTDQKGPAEELSKEDTPPIVDQETEDGNVDDRAISTESLRNDFYSRATTESIEMADVMNAASATGRFVASAAQTTYNLGVELYRFLAPIGIKYTPIIASHIRKGVLHLFLKTLKTFYRSVIASSNYVNRLLHNFGGYKKDISALKEELNRLSTSQEPLKDTSALKYTNAAILKKFSCSGRVDVHDSTNRMLGVLNDTIMPMNGDIKKEISVLENVIATSAKGFNATMYSMMEITPFSGKLISKVVREYEPKSDLVESYVYPQVLPGELLLIANLPKKGIKDIEQVSQAYQASSVFLGTSGTFGDISNGVNYMAPDELLKLVNLAEGICDLCIQHKAVYENIKSSSDRLKFGYRHAYQRLAASPEKVSIQDSLMEFVYLKQSFISRVYVAACIDIHDYAASYVGALLSYVKANISQLK